MTDENTSPDDFSAAINLVTKHLLIAEAMLAKSIEQLPQQLANHESTTRRFARISADIASTRDGIMAVKFIHQTVVGPKQPVPAVPPAAVLRLQKPEPRR